MSQTYRCQLQESVTVNVSYGDTVTHALSLTEILPAEEMVAMLREQLRDLGFTEDGDQLTLVEGDTTTVVDLDAMSVTLTRSGEKQLASTVTTTGRGYNRKSAEQRARQGLSAAVERTRATLSAERTRIQRQETEAIQDDDTAIKEILHTALQHVYTESLKRKAAQLGDVMEIHESTSPDGEYELVIKIEQ